jgi:hypothetical protein
MIFMMDFLSIQIGIDTIFVNGVRPCITRPLPISVSRSTCGVLVIKSNLCYKTDLRLKQIVAKKLRYRAFKIQPNVYKKKAIDFW